MRHFGGPTTWRRFCAIAPARENERLEKRKVWFERRASEMRLKPTPLEIKVELILDVLHVQYFKQHIISDYIVDFYLPDFKAIVEADGPLHENFQQRKKDEQRDKHLLRNGDCQILHLRCHEFFNSNELKNKITDFLGIEEEGADLRLAPAVGTENDR